MTVAELIAVLSHLPLDQDVVFSYNGNEDYDVENISAGRSVFDEQYSPEHGYNPDMMTDDDVARYYPWMKDHPKTRDVTRINTR